MGKSSQIIKDDKGNEIAMVRVDKTLQEMMDEKPASRWDPEYWHPEHEKNEQLLKRYGYAPLSSYISYSTCGYRGKTEFARNGIPCIEALCVLVSGTGIDITLGRKIPEGARADNPNRRTKKNDLLFVRSGVGCAGRTAIVTTASQGCIIGGHIFRIVLKDIRPPVVHVWLKTIFGKAIVDKYRTGVGALVLDEGDIKSIPIPNFPKNIQDGISKTFDEIGHYHDQAIKSKINNNGADYKSNMELAESLMNDLIKKTEAVIRGEQEDVI